MLAEQLEGGRPLRVKLGIDPTTGVPIDSVLVEFWLTGTHLGPLPTAQGVVPPTGRRFRVRMMASFEFPPGSSKIVCERPYFDARAIVAALGLDDAGGQTHGL